MTSHTVSLARIAATLAALVSVPTLGMAQGSTNTTSNQSGPMVIEEVHTQFAIAPEYKVSKLDGATAQLVGAHGGMFLTDTILIGAGIYTLTNGSGGRGLTYGGGVVGWEPWHGGMLGLNLRGLVGVGEGTSIEPVTFEGRRREVLTGTRRFASNFFVAEPQADLLLRLTKHLHLDVGGGYRLIGSAADRSQFAGASGTFALRIQ